MYNINTYRRTVLFLWPEHIERSSGLIVKKKWNVMSEEIAYWLRLHGYTYMHIPCHSWFASMWLYMYFINN